MTGLVWSTLIYRASRGDTAAQSTLVYHSHRYCSGQDLAERLLEGSTDFRILAGRLLAQGLSTPGHHHLMSFVGERPGSSLRLMAARQDWWQVMRTLRLPAAALDAMGFIADDAREDVSERLRAVELLCSDRPERAAAVLADIVVSTHLDWSERCKAAENLRRLSDHEAVARLAEETAEQLVKDSGDPLAEVHERIVAVEVLTRLGGQPMEHAADLLRTALRDAEGSPIALILGARVFAALDERYTVEAAELIHAATTNADVYAPLWVASADILAELGPDHVEEAARLMRAVAADPNTSPDERTRVARFFAERGEPFQTDGRTALRAAADGSEDRTLQNLLDATQLAKANPAYNREVLAILRAETMKGDRYGHALLAAELMGQLTPESREDAAEVFRSYLQPPRRGYVDVLWFGYLDHPRAATALAALGPDYKLEAITILQTIMKKRFRAPADKARAAEILAEVEPEHVDEAARILQEILNRPLPILNRRSRPRIQLGQSVAAIALAKLGPRYAEMAAAAQLEILSNVPRLTPIGSIIVAEELLFTKPECRERSAAVLEHILGRRYLDWYYCKTAATTLAGIDPEYRDRAIQTLRRVRARRPLIFFDHRPNMDYVLDQLGASAADDAAEKNPGARTRAAPQEEG